MGIGRPLGGSLCVGLGLPIGFHLAAIKPHAGSSPNRGESQRPGRV